MQLLKLFLFGFAWLASIAQAGPISLWSVEDQQGRTRAYLVGSIHVLKQAYYPLPAPLYDAFEKSDVTLFELDLARATGVEATRIVQAKGTFSGFDTIDSVLSRETLVLLDSYFAANGMDRRAYQKFKPWMLSTTIGLNELQKLGFDAGLGVDLHFQNLARKSSKPVVAFETFAEQIEVLSSDSLVIQERMLKLSLEHLDEIPELISNLLLAWQKGDAEIMFSAAAKDYQRDGDLQRQLERLLDERNARMYQTLIEHINTSDETYFVVVGALHMGGPKGLLALLGDDYSIVQLTVPES